MKIVSFIVFIGFFIVGCGGESDLSSEYDSYGDSLSEVDTGEPEINLNGMEDSSLAVGDVTQELFAQAVTTSADPSTEKTEERSPALQSAAVLFAPENFQVRETHVCRRSGNIIYTYEVYENRIAGPYLCYLIHRYKGCGTSYSPETESCYHNAIWQTNFCRNKLNENIAKRLALGYECEEIEEPDTGDGEDESIDEGEAVMPAEESDNEGGDEAAMPSEESDNEGGDEAAMPSEEPDNESGDEAAMPSEESDNEGGDEEAAPVAEESDDQDGA